jgi:hypothetical protein
LTQREKEEREKKKKQGLFKKYEISQCQSDDENEDIKSSSYRDD